MFPFRSKKKSYRLSSTLVRHHREKHTLRIQRKRLQVSKMFLQNIKTKFFAEYKYIIAGVLTILIFGGSVGIIFFSHFFDVANIIAERTDLTTNTPGIQDLLKSYVGQNILLVDSAQIEYDISKNFPEMKEIQVSKLLPRTIKVKVVEYPVVARIRGFNQTKEMFLNEIGMVRDLPMKNTQLPLVEYKTEYTLNDDKLLTLLSPYLALQDRNRIMRPEELDAMLQTKNAFERDFSVPITGMRYYPLEREVHLLTARGFLIWVDLTKDTTAQLLKLKQALADFNINKVDLSYVDLRVSNKIIYCTKNSPCTTYAKQ